MTSGACLIEIITYLDCKVLSFEIRSLPGEIAQILNRIISIAYKSRQFLLALIKQF